MRAVQISYLIEHPEYIPQLAQWLFEQWGSTLGEETLEARIKKLKTHMNRDKLPIAWVAHANGQLLGTAALRVYDLEGREDLTPWLGGVFVGSHFRRQGIGAALCAAVEEEARSRAIHTLYLFTLDKRAWYSRMGWSIIGPCLWQQRPGDIMCKRLRTVYPALPFRPFGKAHDPRQAQGPELAEGQPTAKAFASKLVPLRYVFALDPFDSAQDRALVSLIRLAPTPHGEQACARRSVAELELVRP